jgi:hypothetical protein
MVIMGGVQQRRSLQVRDGGQICQRCGGSGTLRLGDQSFRTCLECLGQGRLIGLEPASTTAVPRSLSGATAASSAAR